MTRREINLRILCHLNLHTGKEGQLMRDGVRIDAIGGNKLGIYPIIRCNIIEQNFLQDGCEVFYKKNNVKIEIL